MSSLKISAGALCAMIALASAPAGAEDGQLDPAFAAGGAAYISPDGVTGHQLRARSVVARADGRIVIGGSRNFLREGNPDPEKRPLLARLNADGSPDAGFGVDPAHPGVVVFDAFFAGRQEQEIESVINLADGSVIAVGTATAFGPTVGFIIKVDAAGEFDGGFGNRGVVEFPNTYLHAAALDGTGRIVAVGERVGGEPFYHGVVVRLLADGRLDDNFGSAGEAALFEPGVEQLGYLATLAIDASDRVLVGGQYQVPQSGMIDNYDLSIARFTTDGQLDATFADGGWRHFNVDTASDFDGVDRLLVLADGRIRFAGHYRQFDQGGIDRGVNIVLGGLDSDGATDPAFGDAAGYTLTGILPLAFNRYPTALLADDQGRLLVSVEYAISGKSNFITLRASADGILDPAYGSGGLSEIDLAPQGIYSQSLAMTMHEGRPLVAGAAHRSTSTPLVDIAVARLQNDRIFASGFE